MDGGSDKLGGVVAVLEKDSARRIYSISDKEKVSWDTVWTDEVLVVINFCFLFQTFKFFVHIFNPSLI